MSLEGKVVMVTGGCGFIGSHLVEELKKHNPKKIIVVDNLFLHHYAGHPIPGEVLDDPKVELIVDDITDAKKIWHLPDVDYCFNLAVQPLPHSLECPEENFRNNVEIVQMLLGMVKLGCIKRLLHFSSSEVYGTCKNPPMTEDHPFGPSTTYAASKAAGDLLVQSYHKLYGCKTIILRPFNNYGPRQNDGTYAGIIPRTLKRLVDDEPAEITEPGTQTRDYIYVKDTARAAVFLAKVMDDHLGEVFNVSSGIEISVHDIVKALCDLYLPYKGLNPIRAQYRPRRPGDVMRHVGDCSKIRDLGFSPKVKFEDGLKRTVEWYMMRAKKER